MLAIYVKTPLLIRRSRGEGRELRPASAWRQFPALLSTPAVELRVLSCNTAKEKFLIRHLYWILIVPSFAVRISFNTRFQKQDLPKLNQISQKFKKNLILSETLILKGQGHRTKFKYFGISI
jgi:hypothetical protein